MAFGKTPKDYPPAHCDKCGQVTERTKVGVCKPCNLLSIANARKHVKATRQETGLKSWQTRRARKAAAVLGLEYSKRSPIEGQKLVNMARERVVADAVKVFKAHAAAAADTLVALLNDEGGRPEIRLQAAKEILDRSLGRSVQSIVADVTVGEGFVHLTPEALRLAALRVAGISADDAEAL